MTAGAILRWMAIVFLFDASLGLFGILRWQRMAPRLPVRGIALAEAAAAGVLLLASLFV